MIGMLEREVAHHTRLFWRVPIAAFFTVALPMMFLLLLNMLNSETEIESLGISFAQFFTPAIAVFAMVMASYVNLAILTATDRDEGILKRVKGTPLPMGVYLAGRVVAAVGTGLLSTVLVFTVSILFFDFEMLWGRLPFALVILVLGAATFATLGIAVAGATPNGQTAAVVANATILPMAAISGIFFPLEYAPSWLETVASLLPLYPFVSAFSEQWNPVAQPTVPWAEVAVLAVWLFIGGVVAARTFTWEPGQAKTRPARVAQD